MLRTRVSIHSRGVAIAAASRITSVTSPRRQTNPVRPFSPQIVQTCAKDAICRAAFGGSATSAPGTRRVRESMKRRRCEFTRAIATTPPAYRISRFRRPFTIPPRSHGRVTFRARAGRNAASANNPFGSKPTRSQPINSRLAGLVQRGIARIDFYDASPSQRPLQSRPRIPAGRGRTQPVVGVFRSDSAVDARLHPKAPPRVSAPRSAEKGIRIHDPQPKMLDKRLKISVIV